MERKDVYNFAVKWSKKFRDLDIDYIELSPLKVDYQALIEKGIFTASYQIGENKTLNYTFKCQDFEAIQSIYGPKGDCDLHKFFKQEVIVLMSEVI